MSRGMGESCRLRESKSPCPVSGKNWTGQKDLEGSEETLPKAVLTPNGQQKPMFSGKNLKPLSEDWLTAGRQTHQVFMKIRTLQSLEKGEEWAGIS